VICLFGGERLGRRRVCDKCGQPRVFGRLQDTGKPFLGCVRYPNCKNAKLLAGYRF
jgi:ssDNA-binding Zn-finger/Zn-ribbon topoisomerase 1